MEKAPQFTVTDRRKFTAEGELREAEPETQPTSEAPQSKRDEAAPAAAASQPVVSTQQTTAAFPAESAESPDAIEEEEFETDLGPEPTAAESAEQHAAYKKSSSQVDDMLRKANPSAPPPTEMDFEQLVQSIYLSAIVAMGGGTEPGQKPRVDILNARASIDMLDVLQKKTKGNLSDLEERLLQNALFNLRMMFLEITNAIASSAQRGPATAPPRPPRK